MERNLSKSKKSLKIEEIEDTKSIPENKLEELKQISFQFLQSRSVDDILHLLIDSEDRYVNLALQPISDFVKELRTNKAMKKEISESEISTMFGDIESICALNSVFLKEIKRLEQSGSLLNNLGLTILEMEPFFKLYGIYIMSSKEAMNAYRAVAIKSRKFQNMLRSQYENTKVRLSMMMEAPVLRLPQYMVFLKALVYKLSLVSTDAASQETKIIFEDLTWALTRVKSALEDISAQMADKIKRAAVVDIQFMIFKNKIALVDPARYLMRKGKACLVEKKGKKLSRENVYLALFNDMILIIGLKLKIRNVIRMRSVLIDLVEPASLDEDVTNAIRITDVSQNIILEFSSVASQMSWLKEIREAADAQRESAVGAHISDEYFKKMILKEVPEIPLVDSKKIQRELNFNKANFSPRAVIRLSAEAFPSRVTDTSSLESYEQDGSSLKEVESSVTTPSVSDEARPSIPPEVPEPDYERNTAGSVYWHPIPPRKPISILKYAQKATDENLTAPQEDLSDEKIKSPKVRFIDEEENYEYASLPPDPKKPLPSRPYGSNDSQAEKVLEEYMGEQDHPEWISGYVDASMIPYPEQQANGYYFPEEYTPNYLYDQPVPTPEEENFVGRARSSSPQKKKKEAVPMEYSEYQANLAEILNQELGQPEQYYDEAFSNPQQYDYNYMYENQAYQEPLEYNENYYDQGPFEYVAQNQVVNEEVVNDIRSELLDSIRKREYRLKHVLPHEKRIGSSGYNTNDLSDVQPAPTGESVRLSFRTDLRNALKKLQKSVGT